MEYEPGRMHPTSLGWTDPRSEPGELYWPALFTPAKVAQPSPPPRVWVA